MTETSAPAPRFGEYAVGPAAGAQAGGWRVRNTGKTQSADNPLVSIVTIVRNNVATLPRAMDSVLSQDYPHIEYIVIDGESTDGTLELLRAADDRIALWLSERDHGISDAFNKGIALSCGAIVGLLNSDDWYEPGAVRAVVDAFQQSGSDIACGKLQYWEHGRRTYLVTSDPEQLARGMSVGHPTVFVRRECYECNGLFRLDFRLAMDYEWLLRARTAGARFVMVDRHLSNMQGGGIGDRRWRDSQREVARARALHIPGAGTALAYRLYVGRSLAKGLVRRALDAAGLGILRRAYHRLLSPVTVTSSRDDSRK